MTENQEKKDNMKRLTDNLDTGVGDKTFRNKLIC